MSIKLLTHHVLIKLDELEVKTESGIILAIDEKRERKAVEYGIVLQIGPTAYKDIGLDSCPLSIGDHVCILRYSGKSVKDGEDEFLIVNDEDILCIVD
jgi:chaperonin GroES